MLKGQNEKFDIVKVRDSGYSRQRISTVLTTQLNHWTSLAKWLSVRVLDFFTFQHNLSSPQVKRIQIIITRKRMYELSHALSNELSFIFLSQWGGLCAHTRKKKSFIFLSPRHFLFANGGSFVATQEKKKAYFLRKLRNFKENSKMIGFDGEYPTIHPKTKF